jgi:peptide/nickel transport system ATP-binding protein
MSERPLLEVRGLTTRFFLQEGVVHAAEDVTFTVREGERFGIAGESGSGKTVTALSVMGLIDPPGRIVAGEVLFKGRSLSEMREKDYEKIRGSQISMIFQDPLASLNPVMRIGDQLLEVIKLHRQLDVREARHVAAGLLHEVGIPQPEQRMNDYPHQFSGGQRQRLTIALALCCEPDLIIADEPTTALDVTIQAQVLELLTRLTQERGTAVVLITHDLGVLANFADHVMVMYAGRVMESALSTEFFAAQSHPYSASLMESVSRLDRPPSRPLKTIPGSPPDLISPPSGCPFHPRCFLWGGRDRCRHERPELRACCGNPHRLVACHFAEELEGKR